MYKNTRLVRQIRSTIIIIIIRPSRPLWLVVRFIITRYYCTDYTDLSKYTGFLRVPLSREPTYARRYLRHMNTRIIYFRFGFQ